MHEISICVCTFRRPQYLQRLLVQLLKQTNPILYTFNIVVVDNDDMKSGEKVVEDVCKEHNVQIEYHHEPRRNISFARNRAVANAKGDLVAFIDDDEFPSEKWLTTLVKSLDGYGVDGVLGPVRPHFETTPPKWIVKSRICERPEHKTGEEISYKDMRTGNVLVKRELFTEDEFPFDPKFGTIGGGDVDFFTRMVSRGRKFVWDNDAAVFETVSPDRLYRSYYLKRALVRGYTNSKRNSIVSMSTVRSIAAMIMYLLVLPVVFVTRRHLFIKYLISACDHSGKLLGHIGIVPVKERPYSEQQKKASVK